MTASASGLLSDVAIEAFRSIVGEDGIHLDDADRDAMRDPYWIPDDSTYDSGAVLFPTSTEQVQAIVRVANEHHVPLWTSSQGRNNAYGGPAPRLAGSVLVSLRRMNRVLEIDGDLAVAVVEPGVRWFDLVDALHASGNDDLMVSVPDIGWGSVIGNSVDNGITYLPQGADFQAPCGMEIVLPDGELLRTGMGALPDGKAWHLYKRGLGPTLDPLFTQSNLGIVTRMGYWLMRRPEAYAPLYLTVPRHDQLGQAVDIIRNLRLSGALRGVPCLFNLPALAMQNPVFAEQLSHGPLPEAELQAMADDSGLGRWGMRGAVWGDRVVVDHQVAKIREAWSALDGSDVIHSRTFAGDEWDQIADFPDKVQAGIPTMDLWDSLPPNLGHIGFSPVVPLIGRDIVEVERMMSRFTETELNHSLSAALLITNDRTATFVCNLSLFLDDPDGMRHTYTAIKSLVGQIGELGYGEYRAHLDFMDTASAQYSFNDHAYRRFVETIKDAVDPNGILSPGRHGIWPAAYRQHADRA
ncbi:FAD-binding oxidoreductase [Okibacterium endophyticum]